jgi:hypothetical protein
VRYKPCVTNKDPRFGAKSSARVRQACIDPLALLAASASGQIAGASSIRACPIIGL